jgi:ATP-binding cassette subfamily C protein
VAIYGVITYLIGRKIVSRARTVLTLTGRIQGIVLQLLNAVSKLRVNGAERQAFAQWAQPYAELQMVSFSQRNLNNALVVFRSAFNYFAVFGIVFVIGWQGKELLAFYHTPTNWSEITGTSLQKIMPTARFVAFHVAFGQFLSAAFGLTQVLIELASVKPLYERVEPILSAEEESDEGSEDPGEVFGEIQVHNVHFRYRPDLPLVLRGLTFEARPGQFVAVAGPSGAGKSSIIRLILGFEQAESGSVFLDGKDVKGLDKRAMRRNFGVVLQNGRVLSGSIFHNITAGANLTRDDAWEAARLAGLDKDIEAMPMGMDTYLGEGATTISGGQRQRLMIARAVIRRPRVIIFDEATSALDNETQAIVNEGLKTVNSTRIVIAHRLSSIVDADIIYAIDEGRVVEAGTYRELMAKNGFFASLARRQLA